MYYRICVLAALACCLVSCGAFGVSEAPTPTTSLPTARPRSALPTRVAPTARPTAALRATSAPTATGAGQPGVEANAAAEREVAQIEADAANVRGLKPKTDVPERFLSKQQLHTDLEQQLNEDYSREEGRRDALELWLMRLLDDRSIDLYQLQIDLLSEQVLGFYDPKKDALFVLGDQQQLTPQARETVAHEFVHSLQDQYHDLEKVRPEHLNDDDRGMAATALIEGDATVAGLQYAQQYMSPSDLAQLISDTGSTAVLDRAPAYIREALIFPYQQGAQFTLTLLQQGRYAAVDAALADPPRSTEQILHPKKYLTTPRDEPLPVALPTLTDTLGVGWGYRDSDTLGEFDLGVLLRENGVKETDTAVGG